MLQFSSIAHSVVRCCYSNDPNYLAPALVSSILSFVLYANTFSAEFVYDDSRAIVNNHDLLPETPWYNILLDDFWGTPLVHSGSHKSYRPLTVATFRLNYKYGGLNPFGYHLVNVLLHSATAALVSLLSGKLSRKNSTAWFAGLLFASHPIHTEAVAGVVGRADVLATLLCCASFFNYLTLRNEELEKNRNNSSSNVITQVVRLSITISLAFFAMLAKEQGLAVLGICILYDLFIVLEKLRKDASINSSWLKNLQASWHKQMIFQQFWTTWSCLTFAICTFLSFRIWIMGTSPPDFSPSDNPAAHSKSFETRLLTFFYLPVFNLKLLICPSVLSFDWSMDAIKLVENFYDSRNLLSLLLYSSVGYFCVKLLNFQETTSHSTRHSPLLFSSSQKTPKSSPALPNGTCDINGNPCHFNFDLDNETTSKNNNTLCSNSRCVQETLKKDKQQLLLYKLKLDATSLLSIIPDYCNKSTVNLPCFCLFWIVVTFLPASNLLFYVGFVVAERVLYLPSVGYCIFFAYGAERLLYYFRSSRLFFLRTAIKLGLVLVLVIFSGRTFIRNKDWSNEELLYKSGIVVNPSKAYSNLGNVLSKSKRYDEAESAYKAAIFNRPNMADTHYNLGILLQETGRLEEALQAYENAIHCRERLAVAHLNMGIVLAQLNRKKEAEERYKRCSELNGEGLKDPKTHENAKLSCLYNLGRLEADQGKYQQAIKTYHTAIERLNSYYQPHSLYNMLGESYSKLNDFHNAEKWFKASLNSKPDHIPAYLTYGHLLLKQNQKQLALEYFLRAVELNPTDYVVYQHVGQYYFETAQFEQAEKAYLTALQLDVNNFDTVFSLANVYRHLNNNEESEKFYRRAVELRPNSANAHMNLGAILHLNKKFDDAEESYLKALDINPDDQMTHENLRKLKKTKKKR